MAHSANSQKSESNPEKKEQSMEVQKQESSTENRVEDAHSSRKKDFSGTPNSQNHPRNRKDAQRRNKSSYYYHNDPSNSNEDQEDEFFGNQVDYVPQGGSGIGGHYREPSAQGRSSYDKRYRKYQASDDFNSNNGILSIRQAGQQAEDEINGNIDTNVLTMRQQGYTSQELSRNAENKNPKGRRKQGQRSSDPDRVWQETMDSIRSGKYRGPNQNHKKHSKKRPPRASQNQEPMESKDSIEKISSTEE